MYTTTNKQVQYNEVNRNTVHIKINDNLHRHLVVSETENIQKIGHHVENQHQKYVLLVK